ncbi:MAG: winged helix-turn-helix domain-containing tetratricopeptide repeat protein [Gammaproteobacteria bacterium]
MPANREHLTDLDAGFGVANCWVEPLAGIVQCGDQRLHVEPKVMDVLQCLARRPGEIVTRDELMSSVWGGTVVTDDVLTRCISELRTLLGDTDRERRFIRTIPKRGYSLIAPVRLRRDDTIDAPGRVTTGAATGVETLFGVDARRPPWVAGLLILGLAGVVALFVTLDATDEATGEVESAAIGFESVDDGADTLFAARPAEAAPRSIAVLPFVNLSADREHDFFTDGLSEDIRNGMLTSTELRVSARTSSRAFKDIAIDVREIGRQLEVDALLEGTVRISGDHLRVTTQLTSVADGGPLWASSYERDLGESISTQVAVAQAIVDDLAPTIINGRGIIVDTPTNIAAHEYYLLGRHHWHLRNAASLELAITYFEQSIEQDPDFALGYSGLSDAHLFRIGYAGAPETETVEIANGYAQRAAELGPELAETHASIGLLQEHLGQPERARDAYLRAVEIKPQYSMAQMWLGNTLMELRDIKGSFEHLSIARNLDPLHPQVQFNFSSSLMMQGRYEEAKASIDGFLRYRQNEALTQQKLMVDFYTGRYDLMLQNAVRYTHGGAFTPYNSRAVIESLIYLRRFDEAERMIANNVADMDAWLSMMLRAELAVARRDADALRDVVDGMREINPTTSMKVTATCRRLWSDAFVAAADFIARDYPAAAIRFRQLVERDDDARCMLDFPEGRPTILTYLAASLLAIDPNDARADGLLAAAADEITRLRDNGFDTPAIGVTDAAVRWHRGDIAGARAVLDDMSARGWRVFGIMRFSPVYDSLLAADAVGAAERLEAAFAPVERDCADLGLSKLGL